jgi:predicted DNA-binding protein (MmcQ/YjbR family)
MKHTLIVRVSGQESNWRKHCGEQSGKQKGQLGKTPLEAQRDRFGIKRQGSTVQKVDGSIFMYRMEVDKRPALHINCRAELSPEHLIQLQVKNRLFLRSQ